MVAIVGGGICGLAIGWRLAQAGHAVTIYDRREVAREATWASSGYLIATSGDDPFAILIQEGRAKWPDFAAELSAASGQDLDYRREGSIAIADAANAAEWRAACAFEQRLGWAGRVARRQGAPYGRTGTQRRPGGRTIRSADPLGRQPRRR